MLSRSNAIILAQKLEGKYPNSYMNKSLKDILKKINIKESEFIKICENFTNKKIFKTNNLNKLIKDKNNNLIKINYDN
jgi:hypothetical protein